MLTSGSGQCVVGAGLKPIGIISNGFQEPLKAKGVGGMRGKGGIV